MPAPLRCAGVYTGAIASFGRPRSRLISSRSRQRKAYRGYQRRERADLSAIKSPFEWSGFRYGRPQRRKVRAGVSGLRTAGLFGNRGVGAAFVNFRAHLWGTLLISWGFSPAFRPPLYFSLIIRCSAEIYLSLSPWWPAGLRLPSCR
jgi:hypothetical protein